MALLPIARTHDRLINGNFSDLAKTEQTEDFYVDKLPENTKFDTEDLEIAKYFREREANREPLLTDSVKNEIRRINLVRARICKKTGGDPSAIETLQKYRQEWRAHARNQCDDNLRKIPKKFKDLKKQAKDRANALAERRVEQARYRALEKRLKEREDALIKLKNRLKEREDALIKRPEDEKRILEKVKSWPLDGTFDTPAEDHAQHHSDPHRYFDVRKITFKEVTSEGGPEKHFEQDGKMEKYTIEDFLKVKGKNISSKQDGKIRYYHLPANNMDWIEKFMARYYGEVDVIDYNDWQLSTTSRKGASNVLRREFWAGQQHGSAVDPVHARHMRSKLCIIPSDRGAPKKANNFALFMPFLHWEISKRSRRMTQIIDECAKKADEKKWERAGYERPHLVDVIKRAQAMKRADSTFPSSRSTPYMSISKIKTPLGRYMLQVARVFDMIECERDERSLREDLFKPSPLHPRRTLDQSYHWKLENTTPRDRDQVVYRGTKGLLRPRQVVMVDQLWLWILDEETIVTAFPRRWGINKPDSSGVHKAVRERLKDIQEGDIKSIYDLASIIIDQCSRVFFDRTKPEDERPEVLDIFANAIANVSELSTNAFDEFWRHIEKLNHSKSNKHADRRARANYFNINSEVLLLREALDICEELKMMQRIHDYQIHIAKEYRKALTNSTYQVLPNESEIHFSIQPTYPGANFVNEGIVKLATKAETSSEKRNNVPKESIAKASDLLEELEGRKLELEDLERAAKVVSDQLTNLLGLKQQQASALEAKAALRQGQSIMIFTIVTIVFLPLGFMTSFFGMNNSNFMNHPMHLSLQFTYIFPISLGVIAFALFLAFGTFPAGSPRDWGLLPTQSVIGFFQRCIRRKKRTRFSNASFQIASPPGDGDLER